MCVVEQTDFGNAPICGPGTILGDTETTLDGLSNVLYWDPLQTWADSADVFA